jgi:hypothetical protein
MQAQVTFVRHNPKQVNGSNGTFTVHEFFTADNTKFETTKQDVANAAYALAFANEQPTNQLLVVNYDEKQNGQWTNRHLSSVQVAGAGALAPGVMPSGSAEAPTGAPTAQAAPAAGAAPTDAQTGTRTADHPDTARRIARSVGLELALKAVEGGVVSVSSQAELFDVAQSFGAYVFNGSRPTSSPAATRADSSSADGGGVAGVAPAAPAPTQEAAPQLPADDDIPF